MKRIAFAIEKGGTAKTTCAVHLSYALASLGRTVLLVDTDTQDQCASHLGLEQFRPGLAEIMLGLATPKDCVVQARPRLFLLPAGEKLPAVKFRLMDIAGQAGVEPTRMLETALGFTREAKLDYVIVDSAPGSDPFLVNVLLFSETIIVPVPPEMLAVRGMVRFFHTVRLLGRDVTHILPTLHDRRVAKTARIVAKLREKYPDKVLEPISYTSAISEAAGAGLTLFEYQPRQRAAQEYLELARTLDQGA